MPDWYQVHVVPTLGDGSPFVNPGLLTGGIESTGTPTPLTQPTYRGTAAPGATVRLFASGRGSASAVPLGRTVADTAGNWTLTTRPLPLGTDRVSARAVAIADPSWPHVLVTSKASLGRPH